MTPEVKTKLKRINEIQQISRDATAVPMFVKWAKQMGCPASVASSIERLFDRYHKPLLRELETLATDLNAMGYDDDKIEEDIATIIYQEK